MSRDAAQRVADGFLEQSPINAALKWHEPKRPSKNGVMKKIDAIVADESRPRKLDPYCS